MAVKRKRSPWEYFREVLDTHEFRLVRRQLENGARVVDVQHRPPGGGEWESWRLETDGLAYAEAFIARIGETREYRQHPFEPQRAGDDSNVGEG